MLHSNEEDWQALSNRILKAVQKEPPEKRLAILQAELSSLPEPPRRMVEHFVSLAVILNSSTTDQDVNLRRQFHLSLISVLTLVAFLALLGGGLYLTTIAGDSVDSKIKILWASVETGSAGVACFGLAAIMFIFTVGSAIKKM